MPDSRAFPDAPYRGIESYRFADRPIFFARENEVRKLLRAVTIYRGVLLYGTTGAGKSSLINAGLIPAALEDNFVPDRIRVQPAAGKELIVEQVWNREEGEAVPPSSFLRGKTSSRPRVILSIDAFRRRLGRAVSERYPLLIFDQFEELITLFEEVPSGRDVKALLETQASILQFIVELLREQTLAMKLVFVFREDYLAKLTKLFMLWPDLQDQYLRLTPPHTDTLHRIIRGPFERPELRAWFGRELSEELAQELIPSLLERGEAQRVNLTEVQIVCSELWQSHNPAAMFKKRGVQGLLEDYTSNAVDKLATDHLKGPAIALLSRLVTPSGTRNIVVREELIDRVHAEENMEREILGHALLALETKTKLIVREQRHGSAFYEIVSEFLVPWIQQQKNERLITSRTGPASQFAGADAAQVANPKHLAKLGTGVAAWNQWRTGHPTIQPNLSGATLTAVNLDGANLANALLTNANLQGASLRGADLQGAQLSNANLSQADLADANLLGANLSQALAREVRLERAYVKEANLASASLVNAFLNDVTLERANLSGADLTGANLRGADLSYAMMVDAKLTDANIEHCRVYGIAAWNLELTGARQQNLTVTRPDEPVLTVDNLEVAQYFYMLLNSSKVREVISTTTSKVVLLLGRFTPGLDAVRQQLRELGYVPVVFDFDAPAQRDFTETLLSLAHMSKFIIAIGMGSRSLPFELGSIVPHLPSVPVVVLLSDSEPEYAMFETMRMYPSVLPAFRFRTVEDLVMSLKHRVLPAVERWVQELAVRRRVLPS